MSAASRSGTTCSSATSSRISPTSRRARRGRRRSRRSSSPRCARRSRAAASPSSTRTRRRRTRPRATATSSSRPAPRRARRSRSTFPSSTRSPPTATRARSTSTRRRRSRRIRRARSRELGVPGVRAAIYDGDTPTERRRQIRGWANLVLTNPDMLHIGVLPRHDLLGRLPPQPPLRRRRRGARLPRRLRLARRERPAAAAPARADLRLRAAVPPRVGDDRERRRARARADRRGGDGRRGRRRAARRADDRALEPAAPRRRARACGRARSARRRGCSPALAGRGLRTICFAKSRKSAELIHRFAADRLDAADRRAPRPVPRRLHAAAAPRDRAAPRRGRAARRHLDRRARARDRHRRPRLRDLGRLPGHGREPAPAVGTRRPPRRTASRCSSPREDALDQYFMREPPALLERQVEAAILDHANPRVLDGHVARRRVRGSGRRERRRDARRRRRSSARRTSPSCGTRRAAGSGPARTRPPRASRSARPRPTRSSSSTPSTGDVLGLAERERAYSTVHEGAVYLHLGRQYLVRELDLDARRALVEPFDGDWYTQAKKETDDGDRGAAARRAPARPRALLRPRLGDRAGRRLPEEGGRGRRRRSTPSRSSCRRRRSTPRRSGSCRGRTSSRGSRRCRSSSRPSTPPSTRSSRCCRCGRCATAGTSAASRRTSISTPARRPSSSTTATPAASGSPSAASTQFEGWVADTVKLLDGLPVRARLPVVRPEPEVRQPQRVPRQGGRAHTADEDVEFRLARSS